MQVDSHVSYYIPLPKLLPSQFDHALRKDIGELDFKDQQLQGLAVHRSGQEFP